jgi:hypothetical protein
VSPLELLQFYAVVLAPTAGGFPVAPENAAQSAKMPLVNSTIRQPPFFAEVANDDLRKPSKSWGDGTVPVPD